MSDVAVAPPPEADSKQHRLLRIAAWIVGTVLVLVLLHLAGIDVWGWFTQLWDTLDRDLDRLHHPGLPLPGRCRRR